MKKLLVISGKGGTGKTTIASAIIDYARAKAFCDCDVDAPNLHLARGFRGAAEETPFYGGDKARIDPTKCAGCGKCAEACRFGAIERDGQKFRVSELRCEGCGVCELVCEEGAATLYEDRAGTERMSKTSERTFVSAELRPGRGNSGKLAAQVKKDMAKNAPKDAKLAVIDGSPGVGCPVIASIAGVDAALIVAEPSLSGLSDLKRVLELCEGFGTRVEACINKCDANRERCEDIEAFLAEKGIALAGKIPYDPNVVRLANDGESIARDGGEASRAALEMCRGIARRLGLECE